MTHIIVPGNGDTKEVRWPGASCGLEGVKSHLAQACELREGGLTGYANPRKRFSRTNCFPLVILLPS